MEPRRRMNGPNLGEQSPLVSLLVFAEVRFYCTRNQSSKVCQQRKVEYLNQILALY